LRGLSCSNALAAEYKPPRTINAMMMIVAMTEPMDVYFLPYYFREFLITLLYNKNLSTSMASFCEFVKVEN